MQRDDACDPFDVRDPEMEDIDCLCELQLCKSAAGVLLLPRNKWRTLEEINLLFTVERPLVSENETEFRRRLDEAAGNVARAERRVMDEVDEISEVGSSADEEFHVEGKKGRY